MIIRASADEAAPSYQPEIELNLVTWNSLTGDPFSIVYTKTLARLTQDIRVRALLDQRRRLILSSLVGGSSVKVGPILQGESDEHGKTDRPLQRYLSARVQAALLYTELHEYLEHPLRPLGLYMRLDSANTSNK